MADLSPHSAKCPKCGAEAWSDGDGCCQCGMRAEGASEPRDATASRPPPIMHTAEPLPTAMSLASLMLLVTLASVIFALMATLPGLAVPVCIFLAPALLRTVRVMRLRKQRGIASTSLEKASVLAGSFFALVVSVSVVTAATLGTFCGVTVALTSATPRSSEWSFVVAGLAALAATLAVAAWLLRIVNKWMKARDRRDFGEESKRWP
jgi:hypothetical protein